MPVVPNVPQPAEVPSRTPSGRPQTSRPQTSPPQTSPADQPATEQRPADQPAADQPAADVQQPVTEAVSVQRPATEQPADAHPGDVGQQRASSAHRPGLYRRVARRYGAGPLHLLALLSSFAFAGFLVERVIPTGGIADIGIWFAGALLGHDLFLFPLYALADRSTGLVGRRHPERLPAVPWTNYLRVPALFSGVLLLVSFPLVFKLDPSDYHNATGLFPDPFLARWLIVTAGLFFVSALLYALRLRRSGASRVPSRG